MRLSLSLIWHFMATVIVLEFDASDYAVVVLFAFVATVVFPNASVEVVVAISQHYSSRLCYLLGPCESKSLQQRRLCDNYGQLWDSCQGPLSKMESLCSAKHKSCKIVASTTFDQKEPGLCCVWEDAAFLVADWKVHSQWHNFASFTWEPA